MDADEVTQLERELVLDETGWQMERMTGGAGAGMARRFARRTADDLREETINVNAGEQAARQEVADALSSIGKLVEAERVPVLTPPEVWVIVKVGIWNATPVVARVAVEAIDESRSRLLIRVFAKSRGCAPLGLKRVRDQLSEVFAEPGGSS